MAGRNEGDASAKERIEEAIAEIRKHCSSHLSSIIVSISHKEGDVLMSGEVGEMYHHMTMPGNENIDFKWSVSESNTLKCQRGISIISFE